MAAETICRRQAIKIESRAKLSSSQPRTPFFISTGAKTVRLVVSRFEKI